MSLPAGDRPLVNRIPGVIRGTGTRAAGTSPLAAAADHVHPSDANPNPMTSLGDMVVGGIDGVPTRLGAGPDYDVLTIDPVTHLPTWEPAAGFANPMTTAGDLIVATTAGVAIRLPKGADGTVLTIDPTTHLPVWASGSGGWAMPFTPGGTVPVSGAQAGLLLLDPAAVTGWAGSGLGTLFGGNVAHQPGHVPTIFDFQAEGQSRILVDNDGQVIFTSNATFPTFWFNSPSHSPIMGLLIGSNPVTWLAAFGANPDSQLRAARTLYLTVNSIDYFKVDLDSIPRFQKGIQFGNGNFGATGNRHFDGTGDPAGGLGINGDFYYKYDGTALALDRFWHKEGGTWMKLI